MTCYIAFRLPSGPTKSARSVAKALSVHPRIHCKEMHFRALSLASSAVPGIPQQTRGASFYRNSTGASSTKAMPTDTMSNAAVLPMPLPSLRDRAKNQSCVQSNPISTRNYSAYSYHTQLQASPVPSETRPVTPDYVQHTNTHPPKTWF